MDRSRADTVRLDRPDETIDELVGEAPAAEPLRTWPLARSRAITRELDPAELAVLR